MDVRPSAASPRIGHVPAAGRSGGSGRGSRVRPAAEEHERPEDGADEEPEREPAPVAAQRGRERRCAVAGSARRGRSRRRGTGRAPRSARAGSPSRGRCAARGRRSWPSPGRARGPRRARRRAPAPSGRAGRGGRRRAPCPRTREGGRSPTVVSVIAGMPRATNGACPSRLNGKPRSTSCWRAPGRAGSAPVCSRIRSAAVCTSAGRRRARRDRRRSRCAAARVRRPRRG